MAYNSWYMQPYRQAPINGLISVTGIDGARAYPLPPNSSMPLFDANEDVLYVKTTDGAGYPTVKAYSFTAMEMEQPQSGFVSVEELERLQGRLDEISKELQNAQQYIPEQERQLNSKRGERAERDGGRESASPV